MTDTETILIAEAGGSYWLLEGEDHLGALLRGQGGYPVPVRCLRLDSSFDMMRLLPEGVPLAELWTIHPGIAARLERNGEMVDVALPETDGQGAAEAGL